MKNSYATISLCVEDLDGMEEGESGENLDSGGGRQEQTHNMDLAAVGVRRWSWRRSVQHRHGPDNGGGMEAAE
jgi:hypothetical protein